MSNEFDPKLARQNRQRKAEREHAARVREENKRLVKFLRRKGLRRVSDDPSLVRMRGKASGP